LLCTYIRPKEWFILFLSFSHPHFLFCNYSISIAHTYKTKLLINATRRMAWLWSLHRRARDGVCSWNSSQYSCYDSMGRLPSKVSAKECLMTRPPSGVFRTEPCTLKAIYTLHSFFCLFVNYKIKINYKLKYNIFSLP